MAVEMTGNEGNMVLNGISFRRIKQISDYLYAGFYFLEVKLYKIFLYQEET
jgi:hypothetical protein